MDDLTTHCPPERSGELRREARAAVVDARPEGTTAAWGDAWDDSERAASDVGSFLARERRPPWTRGRGSRANLARWLAAGKEHTSTIAVAAFDNWEKYLRARGENELKHWVNWFYFAVPDCRIPAGTCPPTPRQEMRNPPPF